MKSCYINDGVFFQEGFTTFLIAPNQGQSPHHTINNSSHKRIRDGEQVFYCMDRLLPFSPSSTPSLTNRTKNIYTMNEKCVLPVFLHIIKNARTLYCQLTDGRKRVQKMTFVRNYTMVVVL